MLKKSYLKKAAIALPMILLMGGVIAEIAIAGSFIAFYTSQSGFGIKLSDEALVAAKSGVQDAIMKIIRDKNFSAPSGYTLTIGNRNATVVVCRDSYTATASSTACGVLSTGKDEITSTGSALLKRRKVKAMVNVNSVTGEVKVESIIESAI